ncbi:DUF2931 family protein [Vibrio furnissii]|uniref:DUF2931 family protein n=1 Tax=Vibrio furnissii TaxID=29494 RepID=UPI0024BB7069|nr:DUF2931 family protein [Vibrio furnissii]WHR52737.1 DUF2931 family protein [Vibrio furnissii]
MNVKRGNNLNYKCLITSVLSLLLIACASDASPVPGKQWQVGVVMPSFYPVNVTQAYGVNEEEDWTVMLHNFTQFMTRSELSNAREKLSDYDGYGLPLHSISIVRRDQIGGTTHLPDYIYIYWASLVNTKFYVTKYELDESVKRLMSINLSYTLESGFVIHDCFRKELVFGLLPNGNAKIWLKGCDEMIYVKELPPDRVLEHDSNGMRADDYKNSSLLAEVKERAEAEGVSIDPIPWDKLNKVYTLEKVKTLDEALSAIHQ